MLIAGRIGKAQEGINQRFFTSQHGLKISWINDLTKSQNNTLTIVHGPKFDLLRYDGYHFNYTASSSVNLGKTYEDISGNIWSVDAQNLDNALFNASDKWQSLNFELGVPFMPTPGIANRLLFIRNGNLKEYDKNKSETRIIKQAQFSQIGQFISMTASVDGNVWITGEEGVAKYMVQCDSCSIQEKWIDFQIPESYGLHHFNRPFEGERGELTFMSEASNSKHNVLVGFDGTTWKKLYTSKIDEVHYGWRGHDNTLWVIKGSQPPPPLNTTLRNWDLFHIQQGQETRTEKNRVLNRVLNDIVVESNGAFWLGTGSGLAHFSPALWRRVEVKGADRQRVKKIHESLAGQLWFAAEDQFFLWSGNELESYHFNPLVFTGDVCSLKSGALIVGISETGGLALFDPVDKSCSVAFPFKNEKVRYYDHDKNGNCFIVLEDKNGKNRLVRYNGEHTETLCLDLKIDGIKPGVALITDIIQDRNEDVWVVTFTDVMVYRNGIKKSFDLKTEFEWGISTSILELRNGNIWISGSKGIIQYDGENWSLVQTPEFETARKMIITGDSSILVASGTGIHKLINGSWISNSDEEGLPNTTIFDVFEDKQGDIWAATLKGAYRYYPEADADAPETIMPSDMNSHEAIPSGELQFVFEGHDKWNKTHDDRLLYSYRFDNNTWTPFKNATMVRKTGLSTGSHVFEVRAMDRNGNVDPTPASWMFTVMHPWYKEPIAIFSFMIGIFLIILSLGFAINRHFKTEKLVTIRTAQLNESKKRAEESDRLKSAFLANISHEIRTPMNGILGFSSLLKEADLSGEEQKKYIDIIESSGQRMLSIINDVISISKIESGQMELNVQETNINEQIEYIYTFFKPEVEQKGLEFLFRNYLRGSNAVISTDREKLYAVLTNLVKNAIKYTENGMIEFGCDKIGEYLQFYVKDTGIGIPADRIQAIFERFIQADVTNKMARQGAGLGLSISKAYIEMLGGKIWVDSIEGRGSAFYFTIPYVTGNEESENSFIDDVNSNEVNDLNNLKILIAEDDETSSMLLSIMMNRIIKEVYKVSNGLEAVDFCLNNPDTDLVLMDIQMPELNGFEATKRIREFNQNIIIIAQTAFALSGDKEKVIEAGCNDYITKPVMQDKLKRLLFKQMKNN